MKIVIEKKKKAIVKVGDVFRETVNGAEFILAKVPVDRSCFKVFLINTIDGRGLHYGVEVEDFCNITDKELKEILYYDRWQIKVDGKFMPFVFDNE